ncbi:MAG: GNAT family N-acetyltransferase [Acidimicrobiia bacterium]|nr:GNAT family N-acetyltransferase [Acidimicrobiia bacterium]
MLKVRVEGDWPGPLVLQRGWQRAVARPWNAATPRAHLRIERGGPGFLEECARALLGLPGLAGVLSPPLLPPARPPWEQAGFGPHARLILMRRELDGLPPPAHLVTPGDLRDLDDALAVDQAAFDTFWQFDRTALLEAVQATARHAIHLVRRPGGGLAGFAVIGRQASHAYLQRVAVDPAWQGRGLGRSLVRASAAWAEAQGASALLLNTPEGNLAAAGLYAAEGFRTVTRDLMVLGRTA